jgi:hypothetical protein
MHGNALLSVATGLWWGNGSMRRTAAVLIFLALALAACQQVIKPDASAVSANKALFDQVRSGQGDALVSGLPAGPDKDEKIAVLARVRQVIPAAAPRSITPVAATLATSPGGRVEALVVEYDFADRAVQFATTLAEPKGTTGWKLVNFRLLEKSHKELAPNTLSLDNRSPGQLIYFALAVTSPLLMLAALVKVLRTPGLQNRWLWAAFALVGLFNFQMNWASGTMLIQWMALQIVGFWMVHGPSQFEPWMISATVPIGALLILGGLVARKPKAA